MGIDFVHAEFGGEIGDRISAEDSRVRGRPGLRVRHVLLEPAMSVIDPAIEDHFRRPTGQALDVELAEQGDRIVIELPPADWIEIAENRCDFRVPRPPQVLRQRPTLVEQGLGGQFASHLSHFSERSGLERRHSQFLRRAVPTGTCSLHRWSAERPGEVRSGIRAAQRACSVATSSR